jgi:phage N-6-adenine-methyltransferase
MDNRVHFSSATDRWETPWLLFRQLDAQFHFEVDVCALPENAKCRRFYSPDDDGLAQPWQGVCWMNPPYGRNIGRWVEKAYESAAAGDAVVVCLVPARTDTSWWHRHVMAASEVWLVAGRVRFGNAKAGAPFPSAIVVFRPGQLGSVPALRGFHQN